MRRAATKGFTLIELIVAMAVMLVAVAAATTLLVAAMRLARDSQGNVEAGERARLASAEIIENLERAGMGVSKGLTVVVGGAQVQTMPIYGSTATGGDAAGWNGSDDLWLVAPARKATGEACFDSGARVPLSAGLGANIQVPCSQGFTGWRFLQVVTPGSGKGAVLTISSIPSGTTINYAESAAGLPYGTNAELMGVRVLHYYIALNPNDKEKNGTQHPALWRAEGAIPASGGPFVNATTPAPRVEIPDVEDLQVKYATDPGTRDPLQYTWSDSQLFSNIPLSPNVLTSVRLSIVARSHLRSMREGTAPNPAFFPLTVENHAPAPTPDGFERVIFTRRVELPNMAPESL